jgi:hypothetical protein
MATHTVYGVLRPGQPAEKLFEGTEAQCKYELFRLGRGSWADLRIFPIASN